MTHHNHVSCINLAFDMVEDARNCSSSMDQSARHMSTLHHLGVGCPYCLSMLRRDWNARHFKTGSLTTMLVYWLGMLAMLW